MSEQLQKIYDAVSAMSGVKVAKKGNLETAIMDGLAEIKKQLERQGSETSKSDKRISDILEVVMELAKLDYSHKAKISDKNDHLDGLAAGINMLGEELQASTISLHEKEVLLREIHHRVKNNLQIISSLLNLQSEQFTDAFAREKYLESRIRTMALVHEKLYESKNLSRIDFSDYIISLVRSLELSYNPDHDRIRMEMNVQQGIGDFRIDTAIPCGLLMNELLLNSYKHAFPDERRGFIRVSFGPDTTAGSEANYFILSIEDNGIGLPAAISPSTSETLGLQLIDILSQQLEAELSIERNSGTKFSLRFRPD